MAIIKREDIDKCYTKIIEKYISDGYWVHTRTMSGSQGEDSKIDITNGKHILRIWMDTHSCENIGNEEDWLLTDVIRIYIEEFDNYKASTLWCKRGNMLESITFYRIGSKNFAYTMDETECEKLLMININRMKLRRRGTFSNWKKINYNPDTIIKIVNSRKGFKSCKKKDIKCVERCKTMYRITVEGKNDSVCVRFPNKINCY